MDSVDELSSKFAELDNEYKQIMDTDWWLMSIIITIELTALPLIVILVLAILDYRDKHSGHRSQKTVDTSKPIFPDPSRETCKLVSEHWSGRVPVFTKSSYSGFYLKVKHINNYNYNVQLLVFKTQDNEEWPIEKTRV